MSDQLRTEKQAAGKPNDSAFKMSSDREQELIRDFHSPFPEEENDRDEDRALLRNAEWQYCR